MNILFHTIAIEPARWTPERVSCQLAKRLPSIANAGFLQLEIYEPHLDAGDAVEIREGLAKHQLVPVILSSYLNLNPTHTSDSEVVSRIQILKERIEYFGFKKVRLFPGLKMLPEEREGTGKFVERLKLLALEMPQIELLLETHDNSLADDPRLLVRIVEELNLPNIGLLYQPTIFTAEKALEQWALQKHLVRHFHLLNQGPERTFTTHRNGVIPWKTILAERSPGASGTIEFTPRGICTVEEFNLDATLAEARSEADYIADIIGD